MCGIVALLGNGPAELVEYLLVATRHRGPDSSGRLDLAGCTLAMNRLSIRDPRPVADQPMSFDQRHLVYNGEIYNTDELRQELLRLGHSFETTGDTEIVLHAIAEWGAAACARMHGMYAFACWDERRQTLSVARDVFGIKPLYWASLPGGVIFASEAAPIAARVSGSVRPQAIDEYLHLGASITAPAWESVVEVEPGTWTDWHGDGTSVSTRFTPSTAERVASVSASDDLPATIVQVVGEHLLADRPLTLFLSGGFDSALLAVASKRAGVAPHALTIATSEAEVQRARSTARALELDHDVVTVPDRGLGARAERFLRALDQPTVDGFNTWLVAEAAHERGFPVALGGTGGDELLGGYGYSRLDDRVARVRRAWNALPSRARPGFAALGARVTGRSADRMGAILDAGDAAAQHRAWRMLFSSDEIRAMTGRPFAPSSRWSTDPTRPRREQLRALDFDTYLRPVLLRDSDVFSMAHGVELRVPLIDQRLLACAARTPDLDKLAVAHALDEPLLVERATEPKLPFALPWARWFDGPLSEQVAIVDGPDPWDGLIDPDAARGALGRRTDRDPLRTWALTALAHWLARPASIPSPAADPTRTP